MSGDSSDFREVHLRKADFVGAFGLITRGEEILLVGNRRCIEGEMRRTWDLPGGQVEPGETLGEALARELEEEICVEVLGSPEFLFVQEGVKSQGGRRCYAWRSFFFAVGEFEGEPVASGEVEGMRWVRRGEIEGVLDAPYHDSFQRWLEAGGHYFRSSWDD